MKSIFRVFLLLGTFSLKGMSHEAIIQRSVSPDGMCIAYFGTIDAKNIYMQRRQEDTKESFIGSIERIDGGRNIYHNNTTSQELWRTLDSLYGILHQINILDRKFQK